MTVKELIINLLDMLLDKEVIYNTNGYDTKLTYVGELNDKVVLI